MATMSSSSSSIDTSVIGGSFAKKRLLKDLKELLLEQQTLTTVSVLPTEDIFEWHCNLRPDEGPYTGTVFHLILKFDDGYPRSPPRVQLCTSISHPNVFDDWYGMKDEYPYVCLDMLKSYESMIPYAGWTPAYSVTSILLQLQSFLFAENIPQDWGGNERACHKQSIVGQAIRNAQRFTCTVVAAGGKKVTHTHSNPWPPLLPMAGQNDQQLPQRARPPVLLSDMVVPILDSASAAIQQISVSAKPPKMASFVDDVSELTLLTEANRTLDIPTAVLCSIFCFLHPTDLIKARDVCSGWRKVVVGCNLFERSRLTCFFTKKTMDDKCPVLGVGISIDFHLNGGLKSASSPLDVLSLEAFQEHGVRTGVFGKESFQYFLPLILNQNEARFAVPVIEQSILRAMARVPTPPYALSRPPVPVVRLYPHMILHLLSTLMNTMVVELMKGVTSAEGSDLTVKRHASERALEGYCAFHHMLLFFSKRYHSIEAMANRQVNEFISNEDVRLKKQTPDLGNLLVCLTLSKQGWASLWKPLMLEVFDRNVRWTVKDHPELASYSCPDQQRLDTTFAATVTSRRLLMFQVYFMKELGRPVGTSGPMDVLSQYNQRLGRPTTAAKEDL